VLRSLMHFASSTSAELCGAKGYGARGPNGARNVVSSRQPPRRGRSFVNRVRAPAPLPLVLALDFSGVALGKSMKAAEAGELIAAGVTPAGQPDMLRRLPLRPSVVGAIIVAVPEKRPDMSGEQLALALPSSPQGSACGFSSVQTDRPSNACWLLSVFGPQARPWTDRRHRACRSPTETRRVIR